MTIIYSGTGKIYIGLRIVETLLANGCPQPILIIFSTNQTLDRFLEGVLKFCNDHKVVRVSDSKSGIFNQCNLSSIKSRLKLHGNAGDIAVGKSAQIMVMTTINAVKYRHIIDGSQPRITGKIVINFVTFAFTIQMTQLKFIF